MDKKLGILACDGLTTIGSYAFYNCNSLSFGIQIPSVTKISANAFTNCYSLRGISAPLVTEIGSHAFSNCYSLPYINFPTVKSIYSYAFGNCSGLSYFIVPKTCTNISAGAFSSCDYNKLVILCESATIPTFTNGWNSYAKGTTSKFLTYANYTPSASTTYYFNLLLFGRSMIYTFYTTNSYIKTSECEVNFMSTLSPISNWLQRQSAGWFLSGATTSITSWAYYASNGGQKSFYKTLTPKYNNWIPNGYVFEIGNGTSQSSCFMFFAPPSTSSYYFTTMFTKDKLKQMRKYYGNNWKYTGSFLEYCPAYGTGLPSLRDSYFNSPLSSYFYSNTNQNIYAIESNNKGLQTIAGTNLISQHTYFIGALNSYNGLSGCKTYMYTSTTADMPQFQTVKYVYNPGNPLNSRTTRHLEAYGSGSTTWFEFNPRSAGTYYFYALCADPSADGDLKISLYDFYSHNFIDEDDDGLVDRFSNIESFGYTEVSPCISATLTSTDTIFFHVEQIEGRYPIPNTEIRVSKDAPVIPGNYLNETPTDPYPNDEIIEGMILSGYDYSIQDIDEIGNDYTFSPIDINGTEYYESTNKGVQSSAASIRVSFDVYTKSDIKIKYINYAEASWDFAMFTKLDTHFSYYNYNANDRNATPPAGVYHTCYSSTYNKSTEQELVYSNVTPGKHFIEIKFRKDRSGNSYNDSVRFRVEDGLIREDFNPGSTI